MSTICFDPMEIKGLAESLIEKGHDREHIYNVLQAAHVANALAYQVRYGDEAETYDLRDPRIQPDMRATLIKTGPSSLIYNCDRQMPAWLEDRLYELCEQRDISRWELNEREMDRCAEASREAIEDGMPHKAAYFAQRAAHLGRVLAAYLPLKRIA